MAEALAPFRAFRIHADQSSYRAGIEQIGLEQLNPGEVLIRTAFSSVNYKDALAGTGQGKILRKSPLVGGIDCAGTVVSSSDTRFQAGDAVLLTGCGLSETRDGGYSEYARMPAEWVVPLPAGLTLREAMIIGTAGFTAALSFWRMQCNGQRPDMGPICVTGATGGVGTLALDIGTQAGYAMHAITAKTAQYDYLRALGAQSCVDRAALNIGARPLESTRWAGAIDNVGGMMLGDLSRVIQPWGSIASCGMAGGHEVHSNVMPFIIRGVSILGINSANTPMEIRAEIWRRLAQEWRPKHLERIVQQEVRLNDLPAVFDRMLAGQALGRVLVAL